MSVNIASITISNIKNIKTTDLVQVYNQLTPTAKIKKFSDRNTAETRVWKIVQAEQAKLKAAVPVIQQKQKMGKREKYGQRIIKLLVTENNRKPNTRGFKKFELLLKMDGKSVNEYKKLEGKFPELDVEKGWASTVLRWCLHHNEIKISNNT